MFNTYIGCLDGYRNMFYPLVNFNENSHLDDILLAPRRIFAVDRNTSYGVYRGLAFALQAASARKTPSPFFKPIDSRDRIIRQIETWVDSLIDELPKHQFHSGKLEVLQRIAKEVLCGSKLQILERKFTDIHGQDPQFTRAIGRLQKLFSHFLHSVSLTESTDYLSDRTLSVHCVEQEREDDGRHSVPLETIRSELFAKQAEIHSQYIEEKFKRIFPPHQSKWEQFLIESFRELKTPEEVETAAKILNLEQTITILSAYLQGALKEHFPDFISVIPFDLFFRLMLMLSAEQIALFKELLEKLPATWHQTLSGTFAVYREYLIILCNEKRACIDDLARDFRLQERRKITYKDTTRIDELLTAVTFEREAVSKFKSLLPTWVQDHETVKKPDILLKEYQLHIARLTEREGETENANGCILESVEEKVFQGFSEEDSIEHVLESWKIFKKKYLACLLAQLRIDEDQLKEAQQGEILQLVCKELAGKNLKTVGDFKREGIFNKHRLLEFLNAPILEELYQKVFGNEEDDVGDLWSVFGNWGLISPKHFEKLGLLLNVTPEERESLGRKELLKIIIENLEALKISNNDDLKKKRILNPKMLRAQILTDENLAILLNRKLTEKEAD